MEVHYIPPATLKPVVKSAGSCQSGHRIKWIRADRKPSLMMLL